MANDRDPHDIVTDVDWQMYCDEVLDSHFDGYMVTDANGCWKSAHELTKQVSILSLIHISEPTRRM